MMYQLLYIEINVICMLILLYILILGRHSIDKRAENVLFGRVVAATLLILVLDVAWMLIDGKPGKAMRVANYAVNACFLFNAGLISFCLLMYSVRRIKGLIRIKTGVRLLACLPLIALFVLCASSPWTGWMFTIDQANTYHRSALYPVQIAVTYGYVAASFVYVVYNVRREVNRQRRSELWSLLALMVLPVVGGLLNVWIFGLPATWPATTLSILLVYVDIQKNQISMDALTGLNNRRQLNKYLHALSDARKTAKLYLMLLDIDDFKAINDAHGHLEGDRALMDTAAALKEVCNHRDAFLARYGGDEFAILYSCDGEEDVLCLKDDINRVLASIGQAADRGYTLSLSVGYQAFVPEQCAQPDQWFALADAALYQSKDERKRMKRA